MSYVLAVATFLIGTALGISVAKRRSASSHLDAERREAPETAPKVGSAVGNSRTASQSVVLPGNADGVFIAALNSLPSGVVLADESANVLFRNTAAEAMSGVRHVDVLVDEAVNALLRQTVDNDAQYRRFETAGSPSRVFDLRTRRLVDGGLVATIEDVTERSRVDTVRTDFVANLSHELKTPIGGIAALADTMIGETDPQVIERMTSRIVEESYRLSRIVDDLLDLSRIEFGGADEWERVRIATLVREVIARLQPEAMRSGVTLEATDGTDAEVLGDRVQLVSALENLVINAIKYSGDGKKVAVDVLATEEVVRIAVVDQGIGIAAKDHQRIFERFYRVDRARSRTTGGSGLGLSIVRHVVSNHGGTVVLESEEGRGSTFTIVLPREPATSASEVVEDGVVEDGVEEGSVSV